LIRVESGFGQAVLDHEASGPEARPFTDAPLESALRSWPLTVADPAGWQQGGASACFHFFDNVDTPGLQSRTLTASLIATDNLVVGSASRGGTPEPYRHGRGRAFSGEARGGKTGQQAVAVCDGGSALSQPKANSGWPASTWFD